MGVVWVLQPLCDCGKCVLRCFESILNVIFQGVSHQIYNSLALLKGFIKPTLHLSHLSLHQIDLLTMLEHCVRHLLNNPLQDNDLILHFVGLGIPLSVIVINHGWPSKYLHFTCEYFIPRTQEFISRIQISTINYVVISAIGSATNFVTILNSYVFPNSLVHPQNSTVGFLRECDHVCSQVTDSLRNSVLSQPTKFVLRLPLQWVNSLNPHQPVPRLHKQQVCPSSTIVLTAVMVKSQIFSDNTCHNSDSMVKISPNCLSKTTLIPLVMKVTS